MPRVQFTVRRMMVAVAVVAALLVAPDLPLEHSADMLVATVVGTAVLAVEKARREVERARRRGDPVGPLRFPVRILAGLPIAIIIIAVCCWFNDLSYMTQVDITDWLLDAARPGMGPDEEFLALMWITPRMTEAKDVMLVWAAFRLWDGRAAARSPGLPVAPVPPEPE